MEAKEKGVLEKASVSKEKQTQAVIQPSKPPFVEAALAAFGARRKKERESEPQEARTDNNAYEAQLYRKFWNDNYAALERASYEDTTQIPPMCFTDSRDLDCTFISMQPTLQVFSIKIEEVTGGLDWPLDVYGVVAVRDVVDHKRNLIFYRERDNCQTVHSEDPFLSLTGPTRAVIVTVHPTYFEVDLKVKGTVESDDKDLSLLALCYTSHGPCTSCDITRVATSKLSTLKFNFGHILNSVEATITVDILAGQWPKEYTKGLFTASTGSLRRKELTLVSFEDGNLPIEDGELKLARRVVSVELVAPEEGKFKPKLLVSMKALNVNENGKVERLLSFKPKSQGRNSRIIKFDQFEMKVSVAWSLLSTFRGIYENAMSAQSV